MKHARMMTGGAGQEIAVMVTAWETPTAETDDFAAVTTGQLKATAKPFYDRLMEAGLLAAGTAYPWEGQGLERSHARLSHGLAKYRLISGPGFWRQPMHGLIGLAWQAGEDVGEVSEFVEFCQLWYRLPMGLAVTLTIRCP